MSADMLLSPPTEIQGVAGRYRVEAFLGRGGFGESYRARAPSGAEVTVKVLRLERLDSWKALDLFDREARALAALDHPRIPRLIELFVTDGRMTRALAIGETVTDALETAPSGSARVFLVQSFIPGRSLQALLDAGQKLDKPACHRLARELLIILDYLHTASAPVIHRDVKPSNIILDAQDNAHLIDFGAIQTRLGGEAGSTMIGTLGYFPHEQILGRAVPSSDLYAVGMTVLVALTGKAPEELPHNAATGKVRPPDGLPMALARFLNAVLEPAPGARPATARAALDLLEGKLPAMVPRPAASVPAPLGEGERAKRWLFRASLAAGLGLAGLINLVMFNSLSETKLMALSPFWVVPIVFGAAGLIALRGGRPLLIAALAGILGFFGLEFFLYAIFPSL